MGSTDGRCPLSQVGPRLDSNLCRMQVTQGDIVKQTWHPQVASARTPETARIKKSARAGARHDVVLAGRLTWKDQQGAARFVSVVTRNVSELGAFVECRTPVSIPLYRLVQFQLERSGSSVDPSRVPFTLRQGRVLSAVYRITPASKSGTPQGLALRLLVDPKRLASTRQDAEAATA
jgi:hypothetical protein